VAVGELLFVRDYIGAHHEFAGHDEGAHQVELMFRCEPVGGEGDGSRPDAWQTGAAWLSIAELAQHRLYPAVPAETLRRLGEGVS